MDPPSSASPRFWAAVVVLVALIGCVGNAIGQGWFDQWVMGDGGKTHPFTAAQVAPSVIPSPDPALSSPNSIPPSSTATPPMPTATPTLPHPTPIPPTPTLMPTPLTPTATPLLLTPTPTPFPLSTLLPATLSLPQGQPFRVDREGTDTLDSLAAAFPDPTEAATRLRRWGWQEENVYRIFASDNPPRDAAGWVELRLYRFATVDGAAVALAYFSEGRMSTAGLRPLDLGPFGDQAVALAGPAYNGDEVTIYARRGSILIRVTGISPDGDPTSDVIETVLVPLRQLADEPRVLSPGLLNA